MPNVLRAEGLRVSLGGSEVLRGVGLSIDAGRIVGVLGPSGAGKSTLFRVLVGELRACSGRVWIDGRDVTELPLWSRARAGLGYVPQTPNVLWDLSVAENIRTFVGISRAIGRDVAALAEDVGLADRLPVKASALSGGERRRLELLRALIGRPAVLVLDEPLAGLDPAAVARVCALLKARAEEGMAVLLADHRVREALTVCDEALLLVDGQVELEASPEDFPSHPAVVRRYLG
jgi:lipopolysaccharide export system ATP-binding protein